MTLHPHQTYVIEEFAEDYLNHRLARRDLLHRVLMITGSVPVTASVLFALGCGDSDEEAKAPAATQAPAATATLAAGTPAGVSETDPAIDAKAVTFPGPASEIKAYLARPKANGTYPAILIFHENAGLLPHFKDVARRFAKENFVGLAIDLVSRMGGTTEDAAKNMQALRLPMDDFVADSQAALNYLTMQSFVKAGALGVTGFCFGGGMSLQMAAQEYGHQGVGPLLWLHDARAHGAISPRAPRLSFTWWETRQPGAHPAGPRSKSEGGWPHLRVQGVPGAAHAFFNEDKPVYNKDAAVDAWPRTSPGSAST
jgi:carboxymethylenebutenolidase